MPLAAGRPLDARTRLTNERTRAALQRRLRMAVRTATVLVVVGFLLYRVFEFPAGRDWLSDGWRIWPRILAIVLIGTGLAAVAFGAAEYRGNLRRLGDSPQRQSTAAALGAIVIFALGTLALVAAIARF
jgi:cytochrome bd-type quinol oxidase subunit 2